MNTIVTTILSLLVRAAGNPHVQRAAIAAARQASRVIIAHGASYVRREVRKRHLTVR